MRSDRLGVLQDLLDLCLFGKILRCSDYLSLPVVKVYEFSRLAWHASGTFSLVEHNGGSNGAGLRHGKEAADPANAGTCRPGLHSTTTTDAEPLHRTLSRHQLPLAYSGRQPVDNACGLVDVGWRGGYQSHGWARCPLAAWTDGLRERSTR